MNCELDTKRVIDWQQIIIEKILYHIIYLGQY